MTDEDEGSGKTGMADRPGRIGVVGGGAWGTALATVAARGGAEVTLWAREPEVVDAVNRDHENAMFLPGIALDPAISATGDIAEAASCPAILLVSPAQALRTVAAGLSGALEPGTPVVICAKGIEQGTSMLMSEVLAEVLPEAEPMVLSGPSFADDVARGLPTAVTLAAGSVERARPMAEALAGQTFRPYLSDDLVGTQIGGAVKNVLAIACGIVDGRRLGTSARAALTTRAFAELSRFGRALGARTETLTGLAVLGDLILTCSSPQSRNMSLGMALGEGRTAEEVLAGRRSVSEGVYTAAVVVEMARQRGIEMPIAEAVHQILSANRDIGEAIETLIQRPLRSEG